MEAHKPVCLIVDDAAVDRGPCFRGADFPNQEQEHEPELLYRIECVKQPAIRTADDSLLGEMS